MVRLTKPLIALALLALLVPWAGAVPPLDRRVLVERHTLRFDRYAPQAPASLGNGEFAFSFDITGLQTFEGPVPLGCMANWAWHRFPNDEGHRYEETLTPYEVHGRQVSYADQTEGAGAYFRANPHRFNLARIALLLVDQEGRRARAEDLVNPRQGVSLWSGAATSTFEFDGETVTVETVAHPRLDAVAVRVVSPLVAAGRVGVEVRFAYPSGAWGPTSDRFDAPDAHTTLTESIEGGCVALRKLDDTAYRVAIQTSAAITGPDDNEPHRLTLLSRGEDALEATFHFTPGGAAPAGSLNFDATRAASADHWASFWRSGGAIDLSRSIDPRWRELERRLVLSQFLTAVHGAGSIPPQETGLVCNSWHGKSHLEMHWWHAAHFAAWGRFPLAERSLGWYGHILPQARAIAQRQGYRGARWPKMTGPDGVSSPSTVGEFLVWQQPHPIFFAVQAYNASPEQQTLERYRSAVYETAVFMADYAHFDEPTGRYVLGPVLIPAQECYNPREGVLNPTYEVAYWRWALRAAADWAERLGETPPPEWREVADKIAPPHVEGGGYTAIASPPYTRRRDHPSMLAALGVLPDVGLIDRTVMRRTLQEVRRDWDWQSTWGWDYPMMAMTAARLGRPGEAIDLLLLDKPKNEHLANGHCRQDDRLPLYLPANGGLLYAAALMAAGWEGGPNTPAPGFPSDGSWSVRHEGFTRMPNGLVAPREE